MRLIITIETDDRQAAHRPRVERKPTPGFCFDIRTLVIAMAIPIMVAYGAMIGNPPSLPDLVQLLLVLTR